MGKFTDEDIQLAQKVQATYGVPASVTLGQYALESGYGSSTVGKNNYFNIKGNGQGGYRDYSSKEASFMDYGKLLTTSRYTSQTAGATNATDYVQGVKNAGYAEDPLYTQKVTNIINANNLTQYDNTSYSGTGSTSTGTTGISADSTGTALSSFSVKWWGNIVIVVFAVLLMIAGVAFLALAFMQSDVVSDVKKVTKKVKKGG